MNGYVLRKGDLLCAPAGVGIVTKTTPRYIYYFLRATYARPRSNLFGNIMI